MQKAIFVLDAKDAIIVPKIDARKAIGMICIHITDAWSLCLYTRTRLEVLPKGGNPHLDQSEALRSYADVRP